MNTADVTVTETISPAKQLRAEKLRKSAKVFIFFTGVVSQALITNHVFQSENITHILGAIVGISAALFGLLDQTVNKLVSDLSQTKLNPDPNALNVVTNTAIVTTNKDIDLTSNADSLVRDIDSQTIRTGGTEL